MLDLIRCSRFYLFLLLPELMYLLASVLDKLRISWDRKKWRKERERRDEKDDEIADGGRKG